MSVLAAIPIEFKSSSIFPLPRFWYPWGQESCPGCLYSIYHSACHSVGGWSVHVDEWMNERVNEWMNLQVGLYSQGWLFPFSSVTVIVTSLWISWISFKFFRDLKISSWVLVQISACIWSTACRLEETGSFWLTSFSKNECLLVPSPQKAASDPQSFLDIC